jgi:hypothetical protein
MIRQAIFISWNSGKTMERMTAKTVIIWQKKMDQVMLLRG